MASAWKDDALKSLSADAEKRIRHTEFKYGANYDLISSEVISFYDDTMSGTKIDSYDNMCACVGIIIDILLSKR